MIKDQIQKCHSKTALESFVRKLEHHYDISWPGYVKGRFAVTQEIRDCRALIKEMGGRESLELASWTQKNTNAGWKTSPTGSLLVAISGILSVVPKWEGRGCRFQGNDPFGSFGPLMVRVAWNMTAMASTFRAVLLLQYTDDETYDKTVLL